MAEMRYSNSGITSHSHHRSLIPVRLRKGREGNRREEKWCKRKERKGTGREGRGEETKGEERRGKIMYREGKKGVKEMD